MSTATMETAAMSTSGNGRKRTRRSAKRDINDMVDRRVGLYCRVSIDKDDTGKSTTDQAAIGREWVEKVGAVIADAYIEKGSRSASRFATKDREEYTRLLADIEAGKLEVVWFWEQSRSSRRLDVFAELRNICRDRGVLWVERDRVIDPNDNNDMMMAGFKAIISEQDSEMTSLRVTRGKASSAQAGRRAGRVAYAYKALYASDASYLHDVPDMFDGDGKPVEDSPAYIVREIYTRILAGHSITSIRRDLNDRGVTTKQGYPWANSKILTVATSPTYLASGSIRQTAAESTGSRPFSTVSRRSGRRWWTPRRGGPFTESSATRRGPQPGRVGRFTCCRVWRSAASVAASWPGRSRHHA
jgi:site-specific DNA recombinase